MPRHADRRQRTRSALLEAARVLFAERGVAATTIAAITERAGLGFGTFYLYFRDKEAILRDVLREGIAALHREAAPNLGSGPAILAEGSSILRNVLRYAYQNRDLFRILLGSQTLDILLEAQALFRQHLAAGLAELLGPKEGELTARFVIGVVNQAIIWWFDHDEPDPEEMVRQVEQFLRHGLGGVAEASAPAPGAAS
ncbi:MAG: TetR/AcrR family transcriptional regulator, partial [Chloroflexi bacterium]|nr:TetR/AcrR family transcriptional regulator [Chloroflexota bacterium]